VFENWNFAIFPGENYRGIPGWKKAYIRNLAAAVFEDTKT
jgi:hypothetical protein